MVARDGLLGKQRWKSGIQLRVIGSTWEPVWKSVPYRGFRIQVSRFRFQVGNYLTFLSAWKAVLSEAMVARDGLLGKQRWKSGIQLRVIGSTWEPVWKSVPYRGFRIQVSRFRFQVGNYLTFLSAWKAVLSEAMVARDGLLGKQRWKSGIQLRVIGSTWEPVWKSVPYRGFRIQVSRFRFQVGNYLTFLSAWKAVLSEAMVARDEVSGKYCMDSGYWRMF